MKADEVLEDYRAAYLDVGPASVTVDEVVERGARRGLRRRVMATGAAAGIAAAAAAVMILGASGQEQAASPASTGDACSADPPSCVDVLEDFVAETVGATLTGNAAWNPTTLDSEKPLFEPDTWTYSGDALDYGPESASLQVGLVISPTHPGPPGQEEYRPQGRPRTVVLDNGLEATVYARMADSFEESEVWWVEATDGRPAVRLGIRAVDSEGRLDELPDEWSTEVVGDLVAEIAGP